MGGVLCATGWLSGCTDSNAKAKSQTPGVINPVGSFDTSFGAGGFVEYPNGGDDFAFGLTLDVDSKILVAGSLFQGASQQAAVWRFMPLGIPDAAFGSNGVTVDPNGSPNNDQARALLVDHLGNIVATGQRWDGVASHNMAVWRFLPNGIPESTVLLDTGPTANTDDVGFAITQDQSNRYVITGYGDDGAMGTNMMVWRTLPENTALLFDSAFGVAPFTSTGWVTISGDGGPGFDSGNAVLVQPDTTIMVAGAGDLSGTGEIFLTRLLDTDGAIDGTFNGTGSAFHAGLGSPSMANGMVRQSSGKLVVAGSSLPGASQVGVLRRFNANGTADGTFGLVGQGGTVSLANLAGPSIATQISGLIEDGSGRLVAVGSAGNNMFVARFSANGVLDSTFGANGIVMDGAAAPGGQLVPGAAPQGVAVAVAPDGHLFVAGHVNNGVDNDIVLWKIK